MISVNTNVTFITSALKMPILLLENNDEEKRNYTVWYLVKFV